MSIDVRITEQVIIMRIMQFLLAIILLNCILCKPAFAQGYMPPDSDYLAISAKSLEESKAVSKVFFKDGFLFISIWEDKPFSVEVSSSYPDEPIEILIALSDGKVYDVTKKAMDFRILYLIPYYGLVIAKYPDGEYETSNFQMHGKWKEPNYLPEKPELIMPVNLDDPQMQELIDRWWNYEVMVREEKRLGAIEEARLRKEGN